MKDPRLKREQHAGQIQCGRDDADECDGQELANDDVACGHRGSEQRLQRSPFLFPSSEVDRRIKGAQQRHDHEEEWEDTPHRVAAHLFRPGNRRVGDLHRNRE